MKSEIWQRSLSIVSKHVKFLALFWLQKGYHVEKIAHSRQQLMVSENSIPKVILPDNSFQTVVNISEISLMLFQTVLKIFH